MYILLAISCLVFFFLNVTCDKQGSKGISSYLAIALKGTICTVLSLAYVLFLGHGNLLFSFSSFKEGLLVFLFGSFQLINWIFYFKAIQKAKIEAFTSLNEITFLLTANIWTLFFNFNNTVNGTSPFSIIVYFLGLGMMAFAIYLISQNKGLNEGVDKKWIIIDIIGCIFGSLFNVGCAFVSDLPNDVIIFYAMLIMCVGGFILVIIKKAYKEFKNIEASSYMYLVFAGVFNILTYLLRFRANTTEGANIAVINAIISSYFVFMTLFNAIIQKKKFPIIIWMVFVLMIGGMVLNSVAMFIK